MKTLDEALDEHCKQVFNEKKSSEFVNQAQISFTKGSLFGFESGVKHTKEEYEEKLQKQNETLLKITGWDQPYNLTEILSRLVFATDYLLHVKNYDGHAHEELNQSIDRAKEILQFLETREAHFL